jgi:ABC-type antimicrobial peptide transport system permease subunit
MFTIFGVLALVLSAIGLYGVLGYFVSERTPQIGVRRSLGAPAGSVVALVVRQGMVPVAAGIAIGLVGAFVATRYLPSLLFGVEARDPVSFAGAAVFLISVAVLATLLPAWRAVRVDPMVALRHE